MGKKKEFLEEEVNDILNKYKNGYSLNQIMKEYHCGRERLLRLLTSYNIPIRNLIQANTTNVDEDIQNKIVHDYVDNTMSVYSLIKKYSLSQKVIETILKHHGIERRNYTEAKQLGRKYTLDDNYFKNQTHNMAYILGFLAADGNIATNENGIFIELHEKDEYLLEAFNKETKNNRPLKKYIHNHANGSQTPAVKFQAWSAEWKKDLAIYGIVPKKTFILTPPLFLNKKYYIDYIKGFFDGDGSIYLHENKYYIDFIGASEEVINWIYKILNNQYGVITTNVSSYIPKGREYPIYRFSICKQEEAKKLRKLFYEDQTSDFCLIRKKDLFFLI